MKTGVSGHGSTAKKITKNAVAYPRLSLGHECAIERINPMTACDKTIRNAGNRRK